MDLNLSVIITTIINLVILLAIIVGTYKGVQIIRIFINKNKEMDKKLDYILDKLEKDK